MSWKVHIYEENFEPSNKRQKIEIQKSGEDFSQRDIVIHEKFLEPLNDNFKKIEHLIDT